jgi:ribonuclease R
MNNADKLIALQTVIAKFGYKIDLRSKDDISKSLNSLLRGCRNQEQI